MPKSINKKIKIEKDSLPEQIKCEKKTPKWAGPFPKTGEIDAGHRSWIYLPTPHDPVIATPSPSGMDNGTPPATPRERKCRQYQKHNL